MSPVQELVAALRADAADAAIEGRDSAQVKVAWALSDTYEAREMLRTALRQLPNPWKR